MILFHRREILSGILRRIEQLMENCIIDVSASIIGLNSGSLNIEL